MHLAQGLLMNIQCSGGSRGFAMEMRGLKMRYMMAGHWKLLTESFIKRTQCWPFYGPQAFEASWNGEKSLMSGCLMSEWKLLSHVQLFANLWTVVHQAPLSMGFSRQEYWSRTPFSSQVDLSDQGLKPGLLYCRPILYCLSHQGSPSVPLKLTKKKKKKKKKPHHFEVSLSQSMQQQRTISWFDCDVRQKVDFMWQPAMTSSVAGLRSFKALPKAKLAPKMVMVTVWWSAAFLIHYSFLNPCKSITFEKYTQQIDKMHQKPQGLQPASVNRKGPIRFHNNALLHITQSTLQKLNELGYEASATISTLAFTNWLPLLQAS